MRRLVIAGFLSALGFVAGNVCAEETKTPEAKWYERVNLYAFVDAYGSYNYARPKTGPLGAQNRFRAYDQWNGFALHWVGLDATLEPAPIGGVVSLRFGPSAAVYTGTPDNELGLGNVKQMFATFKPGGPAGKLTVAFGKFDTIYGAEVADSQLNITYTRSMLNYFAQPFFHTGLRADLQLDDKLMLRFLAVNGWNNALDNNAGKTFGTQVVYKPTDALIASIGWLGGPEQADQVKVSCAEGTTLDKTSGSCVDTPGAAAADSVIDRASNNKRWRHIFDVVVDWSPTSRLRALFNFDWATEELRALGATESERKVWWGMDLTLKGKISDLAFVGVRGSYFRDRDGYLTGTTKDTRITSGTLTLGWTPTPNFIVKLEPRIDLANEPFFYKGLEGTSKTQVTTTLGVVANTN